ncbi:MAG TPA: GrpB family protein [Anaerolineae bacterium]|nr:GrpB family protein [Anaerolineae bacterium]
MSQPKLDNFWHEAYVAERARLLSVLGEVTTGGLVEGIQHIGATSVPRLSVGSCIDIGLAIWPFPVTPHLRTLLESLGYSAISDGEEEAVQQRFRHASANFQLFVSEGGSEEWTNHLLIRDYLRDTGAARQAFATAKQAGIPDTPEYQQIKARFFAETLPAAQTWWIDTQGFAPLEAVAREFKDFDRPWYIASGWAIDLFLDRVTRVHHDVDIFIARTDQLALQQHLSQRGWNLMMPYEGQREPWPPHMFLEAPRHQVHAYRDGDFIDCLLSDLSNGLWRYRRDPKVVRQLDRAIISSARGPQFLAPELVLLFKSKNTAANGRDRPQDQRDFDAVIAHLEPERRAWLRWALVATEPTHPWLEQLM